MKRVNFDDVDSNDSLEYVVDGVPYTGEIVEYAPTGEMVELITVVNGLAHGPSLSWYRDGQLQIEQSLARGRPVGRSRKWHPNGALADELVFDESGRMISKTVWNELGEELEQISYTPPPNVGS